MNSHLNSQNNNNITTAQVVWKHLLNSSSSSSIAAAAANLDNPPPYHHIPDDVNCYHPHPHPHHKSHQYNDDHQLTIRLTLVCTILVTCILYKLAHYLQYRSRYRSLPSLPLNGIGGLLFGHLQYYWQQSNLRKPTLFFTFFINAYSHLMQQANKGLFHIRVGPLHDFVVIISAKAAESLLCDTKNITKASQYDYIKPWLGEGLITTSGSYWFHQRKLLTPTFHFQILQTFIPVMNKKLKIFLNILKQIGNIEHIDNDNDNDIEANCENDENVSSSSSSSMIIVNDIRPLVTNFTLDVICQTAMGIEMNAQTLNNVVDINDGGGDGCGGGDDKFVTKNQYLQSLRTVFNTIFRRFLTPWWYNEWIFRYLCSTGRKFYHNLHVLHRFTEQVIEERKREFEYEQQMKKMKEMENDEKEEEADIEVKSHTKRRTAFLDLLLRYHHKNNDNNLGDNNHHHQRQPSSPSSLTMMTLKQIREEVDTFMFAGHDTTATALLFSLYLIGHNPRCQALIHQELDQIFSSTDEHEITVDDTRRMKYLELCIKESIRFFPPVAFYGRKIERPFICDGHLVPSGCTAVIQSYAVHRDPQVYQHPDRFMPERFVSLKNDESSSSNVHVQNPFAYIPFSAGPRNCIGQRFAMLELKIFLATILRIYEIQTLTQFEQLRVNFSIVTKVTCPIRMKFIKRNVVKS